MRQLVLLTHAAEWEVATLEAVIGRPGSPSRSAKYQGCSL